MIFTVIAGLGAALWAVFPKLASWIGEPLAITAEVLGMCGLCLFAGCFYRYDVLLGEGGKPEGARERTDYDALRASLQMGGLPVKLYTDWLTVFLEAVDRFFGDAHVTKRGRAARLFGLRAPAALWTAPAYDRCLLLAALYPVGMIFLIWAISGHVGPAETALTLAPGIDGWRRGVAIASLAMMAFAWWRILGTDDLSFFNW
ncbi:MAG TPA: hypothetical protein VFW37_01405, partial [Alphaproteobacteria bacterium]|nr:hypothetical protein [Alphaproteobacteria bacterium]